jgi:hypothetical protein
MRVVILNCQPRKVNKRFASSLWVGEELTTLGDKAGVTDVTRVLRVKQCDGMFIQNFGWKP